MSNEITEMDHSPVGPSSLKRVINCPGSVKATHGLPDTSSEFAREGNYAHHILEIASKAKKNAIEYLGQTSAGTPWLKDDGSPFECDREMVNSVQQFLDFCDEIGEGEEFIEIRVNYTSWLENGWGTTDRIKIVNGGKTCYVIDFKYGKGMQVWADFNEQAMAYALGFFQDYGHTFDDIEEFVLVIIQPRIGGHRDEWTISLNDLLVWAENIIEPLNDALEAEHPVFKAGDHCQWCKIKGECTTRTQMIFDTVIDEMEIVDDENGNAVNTYKVTNTGIMSDEELGEASLLIEQVSKWCKDTQAVIEQRSRDGHLIPSGIDEDGKTQYWKYVEGRSNRTWRDEAEAEKQLRRLKIKVFDVYDENGKLIEKGIFTKKMKTPPAVETMLGKTHKLFKDKKLDLVLKPKGKPVLVRGDDKRSVYVEANVDEMDDIDDTTSSEDEDWLD